MDNMDMSWGNDTIISPLKIIAERCDLSHNNKVLKYFGGLSCPHSNKSSRVYKLIQDFEIKYPDTVVEYYWSNNVEDMSEFKKANAVYVPTITNNNYTKVELKIAPGIDTSTQTDSMLKELLFQNIYNQINSPLNSN